MLIVFSGLPGTGKTTLARGLALACGAVHVRIDSIENAIARSNLAVETAEDAGYLAGYAIAEDNLRLGRVVVADSVNPIELTRADWRSAAERCDVRAVDIEVICSDPVEHRQRLESRVEDIVGLPPVSWAAVQARDYDDWKSERIVIDTAGKTQDDCLSLLLAELSNRGLSPAP